MKAAVLHSLDRPLEIAQIPNPEIGTGEVIVDVAAAPVLPYANEVFNGQRRYPIELPIVPGCGAIGRVSAIGPDATHLKAGDWVFCDPTVRSRDDVLMPDIELQGWSSRGEGGLRLQRYFHDGPFAEQVRVPTENAIRIGEIDSDEAGQWCALNVMLVPYGGLLSAALRAGETLLVSGATGNFGSACVAVALAMGARCVVAPGRMDVSDGSCDAHGGSDPLRLAGSWTFRHQDIPARRCQRCGIPCGCERRSIQNDSDTALAGDCGGCRRSAHRCRTSESV
jgi:alcohol dehydrogenase